MGKPTGKWVLGLVLVLGLGWSAEMCAQATDAADTARLLRVWLEEQNRPGGVADQQTVRIEAQRVAWQLGVQRFWQINILPDEAMPQPAPGVVSDETVVAHTTRLKSRSGKREDDACMIWISMSARKKMYAAAHEMCHCALDFDVIGEKGWTFQHLPNREYWTEVGRREKRVEACVAKVGR